MFVLKIDMTLHEALNTIIDKRRKQGQRYPLGSYLEMIVLAGMSGHFGINSISRFIKNNKDYFIDRYNLSHGVPSQTGIFNFLRDLDYEELNMALTKWMSQYVKGEEIWISIDGKGLGSTVTDKHNSKQNYKSIVSMFSSERKVVISTKGFESKKEHEITTARDLIEQLNLQGVTFTLDALHCQKKPRKQSWWEEMTM